MSKKALMIVDMLNDFVHEKGALYGGKDADEIIPHIQERLKTFRQQHGMVIYIQDSHEENDREFERYPRHAVTGTWGNEIISALSPETGEAIVRKKTLNSFYGTDLEKLLEDKGIEAVEVVGVCTSICVMDAVGDLTTRGYPVTVPIKEVADFDPEAHAFALKRMKEVYGADVS